MVAEFVRIRRLAELNSHEFSYVRCARCSRTFGLRSCTAEARRMSKLLVVGGGLFGSLAAAYARSRGIEAVVFDAAREGAASPAAAGLFQESWAGKRLREHYLAAMPVLDCLYGIRHVLLAHEDGRHETFC